jgi:peptidoglycan hydrolase CwlO-like protein
MALSDKIAEEKRIKLIQRMILEGNVDKIAHDEGVSESTVRNIWSDAKSGTYPEYTEFIPIASALRNLNVELTTAGVTVTQAAMGLAIFTALVNMDIEPAKLRDIVEMLKGATGGKPPAGFGKIVEELAKFRAETGLDFQQLNNHLAAQRSELSDVQAKVKASGEELASVQSKIAEANEDLNRRLKQNNTTFKDIEQFRESRRILRDTGYGFDDVNAVVDFIKTARAEGFLQASKELATLQKNTGRDFKGIVQEYRKNKEDVEALRAEKTRLTTEVNELTINIAGLKKQVADQLIENNVTKERLDRLNAVIDRLKKGGIDVE